MILSDKDIFERINKKDIKIDSKYQNWKDQIHASSMDLRLGNFFKIYKSNEINVLDPYCISENQTVLIEKDKNTPFIIHPNDFVLGVTLESITLANNLVARVEGRSSLGRLGIVIHSTAGFIDAGFSGTITLEISNLNTIPVALYPEMRVCQLAFEEMSSPALVPYGEKKSSKYQNQVLPEESRINIDPEFKK
jgi:dCTP deaminase